MEKRTSKRIPANLEVKFLCGGSLCSGVITNISEDGMYIKTGITLPDEANFEVSISFEGHNLKVPVKFKRIVESIGYFDTLGVEVLNPTKEYLELVSNLKARL